MKLYWQYFSDFIKHIAYIARLVCLTLLVFGICSFAWTVKAQDRLFSQFYNAPLLTNPAHTGFMDQDYRLQMIYRNQWQQVAPYHTAGASADLTIPFTSRAGQKLGLGLVFFRDQLAESMVSNSILISASYSQILDRAKRHKISLGLQGGYVVNSIDYSGMYFENQIGGDHVVNTAISSGENLSDNRLSYMNLNTGVAYGFHVHRKLNIRAGVSIFNLTMPPYSFLSSGDENINKLKPRLMYTLGGRYKLSDRWYVFPEAVLVMQQGAKEINMGTGVGYLLHKDDQQNVVLMAGGWYRTNGTAIAMLGMGYKNVTFMLSYDQVTSSLKKTTNTSSTSGSIVNAYELSIIYKGFFNRAIAPKHTIPCGIF